MFESYRRYYYNLRVLQKRVVKLDLNRSETSYGGGAEEARGADNPEVTGSKPVLRIITLRQL